MGEVLRRLVSKTAEKAISQKAANFFAPFQVGVGVKGGCEALVHTARAIFDSQDEDTLLMQVDLINAFNLADRKRTSMEVQEHFPELSHIMASCYGIPARLLFGDEVIMSTTGFYQGDALASLFFSLDLHPVVLKINKEVPDLVMNSWEMDDGLLGGSKADIVKAVEILLLVGPERGLHLSTETSVPGNSKSRVWSPVQSIRDSLDPLGLGIKPITEDGFIHLGAPIGPETYVQGFLSKQVEKVGTLSQKLFTLQQPYAEFVLLRSCYALPKVGYLLRFCPPSPSSLFHWKRFDQMIRNTLNDIIGTSLSDQAWHQAQLSVVKGGLGLRGAETTAAAAFISSVALSLPLIHQLINGIEDPPLSTAAALEHLSVLMGLEETCTMESLSGSMQKSLCNSIENLQHEALTQTFTSTRDKARMSSLGIKHAGDWLNVVPNPSLGLLLRAQEFRSAVMYRLGVPMFQREGPCVACGQDMETMPLHVHQGGSTLQGTTI